MRLDIEPDRVVVEGRLKQLRSFRRGVFDVKTGEVAVKQRERSRSGVKEGERETGETHCFALTFDASEYRPFALNDPPSSVRKIEVDWCPSLGDARSRREVSPRLETSENRGMGQGEEGFGFGAGEERGEGRDLGSRARRAAATSSRSSIAATPTTPSRAISQTTSQSLGSLGERDGAGGGGEAKVSSRMRPSSSLVVGTGGVEGGALVLGEVGSSRHPEVTRLNRREARPAPMAKPSPSGWEPSQSRWSGLSLGCET